MDQAVKEFWYGYTSRYAQETSDNRYAKAISNLTGAAHLKSEGSVHHFSHPEPEQASQKLHDYLHKMGQSENVTREGHIVRGREKNGTVSEFHFHQGEGKPPELKPPPPPKKPVGPKRTKSANQRIFEGTQGFVNEVSQSVSKARGNK